MSKIKLSIIINIYNSHEIVRRQSLYFSSMNLPDDIEFIFVDDGSDPKLEGYNLKNLKIHYTNDKRAWTQGLARNAGAKIANGEYIFMTDIDHILSKESILDAYNFIGDKKIYPRFLAILDENGCLSQDLDILEEWGADTKTRRKLYASYHGNTFTMKKSTFDLLGGYPEKACLNGYHAVSKQGEDSYLNKKWNHYARDNNINIEIGPPIYIFPIGRFNKNNDLNPKGLFHKLSYEPVLQPNKK